MANLWRKCAGGPPLTLTLARQCGILTHLWYLWQILACPRPGHMQQTRPAVSLLFSYLALSSPSKEVTSASWPKSSSSRNSPEWPTTHRKRGEAPALCSLGLLENGSVPWATYVRIYRKGNIVDMRGLDTCGRCWQWNTPKCSRGKTGRAHSVAWRTVGIVASKQVKGVVPAKTINVH